MQRMKGLAIAAGMVLLTGFNSTAQQTAPKPKPAAPAKHVMLTADELKWGPGPESLPPGGQAAVLSGDPGKSGMFTIRLKMPDGYTVPPHSHPTAEHVTIVSGTLMMAMGSKLDDAAFKPMTAGAYAVMPARSDHYVRAKGETIVQVMAMGPFEIKYANPNDDPRKKTTTKK